MSRSPEQKIRLLVLYDILKSESDEERPLSTNELIEKLAEYGIMDIHLNGLCLAVQNLYPTRQYAVD